MRKEFAKTYLRKAQEIYGNGTTGSETNKMEIKHFFRGQLEIVEKILEGKDDLIVTGMCGKSLAYELPALCGGTFGNKLCVIVS